MQSMSHPLHADVAMGSIANEPLWNLLRSSTKADTGKSPQGRMADFLERSTCYCEKQSDQSRQCGQGIHSQSEHGLASAAHAEKTSRIVDDEQQARYEDRQGDDHHDIAQEPAMRTSKHVAQDGHRGADCGDETQQKEFVPLDAACGIKQSVYGLHVLIGNLIEKVEPLPGEESTEISPW